MNRVLIAFGFLSLSCVATIYAQNPPPVAMRPAQVRRDLIEHATVVVNRGNATKRQNSKRNKDSVHGDSFEVHDGRGGNPILS